MMQWLASAFERRQDAPALCSSAEFSVAFAAFADALVDSANAGAPAAPPPPHAPPGPLQHSFPAVQRLVAIGDVHGDLGKLLGALRAAKLIDVNDRRAWGERGCVREQGQ